LSDNGTGSSLRVEPVVDEAGLEAFLALPGRLRSAAERRLDVPVLRPTIKRWYAARGAHARYGPVRLVLVRDGAGEVVGRSCLHHSPKLDARLGADAQLFGLTEFADRAALGALAAYLESEARRAGRTRLVGPVALLPNQTGGVVTSGHDERGFVDSPWSPAHYPGDYEALGFQRLWEGQTWICEGLGRLDAEQVFPGDPADAARMAAEGLQLHRGSRRRLGAQLPILRSMLNAAFAQLPYYTPIDADELADQTDGLAWLLDERLLLWLTRGGEPVAFVLAVPDISEFVVAHEGRMGMGEQLRLLATRGRYRREAILVIKGTVPQAQGHGYLTILSRELLRGLQAGGYTTLRSTFVGLDNPASEAQYRRMGGRPLHGTTFYSKEIR